MAAGGGPQENHRQCSATNHLVEREEVVNYCVASSSSDFIKNLPSPLPISCFPRAHPPPYPSHLPISTSFYLKVLCLEGRPSVCVCECVCGMVYVRYIVVCVCVYLVW